MKDLHFFLVLLISISSLGQQKLVEADAGKIYDQAITLSDQDKYAETVELLERINKNDSLYCRSISSRSYYHLVLNQPQKVIEVVDEGLSNEYCAELREILYINKAVACLELEEFDRALEVIELGQETYPMSHKLSYNKGLVHENLGDIHKAIEAYNYTILLNPFHTDTHLRLGNISYKQGKMSQALMSFNMYLLLRAAEGGENTVVDELDRFYSGENPNISDSNQELTDNDGIYKQIDMILNQGVVINEAYSTGNEIEDALVKQSHVLLNQLSELDNGSDLWSGKYLPLYKWILANGHFNNFIYTLYYGTTNTAYQKIIEKNKDEIKAFYGAFRSEWADIASQYIDQDGATDKQLTYYYNDGYMKAVGEFKNDISVGEWIFYDEDGAYSTTGIFNEQGERDGDWAWYYRNGTNQETASYKAGKLNGTVKKWYEDGTLKIEANYKDNELNGVYRSYQPNGSLYKELAYKNDKRNGDYKAYFPVGKSSIEYAAKYVDDEITGTLIEYHANGQVYAESQYAGGVLSGSVKNYFALGELKSTFSYNNGQLEGQYKIYHGNGKLKEEGSYADNELNGEVRTYYINGKPQGVYIYKDGALNEETKNYDLNGVLYYKHVYRNGELIAFSYFDKQGDVINEGRKKKGEFYYKAYSTLGQITAEGLYDVSGGKKGLWKYYDDNGVLVETTNYIDNEAEGESKSYFPNGVVSTRLNYVNGQKEGYEVSFFNNGNMSAQGYNKEGEPNGEWRSYYSNGVLKELAYFHKGQSHGELIGYDGQGRLDKRYFFQFGKLLTEVRYKPDGTVFDTVDHASEKGKYVKVYNHYNGKPQLESEEINGLKHGKSVEYDFYGNKVFEGGYLNNVEHGPWEYYFDNGNTSLKFSYTLGELDGEVKGYYKNGQLETSYTVEKGQRVGIETDYYENGQIDTKTEYQYDLKHGRMEFYNPEGKFQLVRFYEHGKLIGYSHFDSNSEEIPMVQIENETASITAYYDNGKPSRTMEYKNGKLVDDYKTYYYSGAPHEEIKYTGGQYNGEFKIFYPNGNLKHLRTYDFGLLNGVEQKFYEDGTLKSEIEYVDDEKMGRAVYYDEKGNITKEESYFNGFIFNVKQP